MSKPLIIIHVVVMYLLHKDFWFEPRSMMLISNLPKLDDTRNLLLTSQFEAFNMHLLELMRVV